MFLRVNCTCQGRFYTINYKCERCKRTKTKACCKNISCLFICSFIFLYFSSDAVIQNFDGVLFVRLIWWNKTFYLLKIGSNKNVSNFVVYIIKFIWFNPGDIIYNIYDIRYIKCIIKSIISVTQQIWSN